MSGSTSHIWLLMGVFPLLIFDSLTDKPEVIFAVGGLLVLGSLGTHVLWLFQ